MRIAAQSTGTKTKSRPAKEMDGPDFYFARSKVCDSTIAGDMIV
jgi:hypothetical protein